MFRSVLGRVYVSRDAVFDESVYPFSSNMPSNLPPPTEHALLLPEPDVTASTCQDTTCATNGMPGVSAVSGAPQNHGDHHLHDVHAAPDVDHLVPEQAGQPDPLAHNGPAPETIRKHPHHRPLHRLQLVGRPRMLSRTLSSPHLMPPLRRRKLHLALRRQCALV